MKMNFSFFKMSKSSRLNFWVYIWIFYIHTQNSWKTTLFCGLCKKANKCFAKTHFEAPKFILLDGSQKKSFSMIFLYNIENASLLDHAWIVVQYYGIIFLSPRLQDFQREVQCSIKLSDSIG